jgi:hypothetical protein
MDESEDEVASAEENTAPAETPEEKEERDKKEAEKRKELENIDIKSGDYQVQVHIIEARDLKAENFDGTSDPICYIECFGQKVTVISTYIFVFLVIPICSPAKYGSQVLVHQRRLR